MSIEKTTILPQVSKIEYQDAIFLVTLPGSTPGTLQISLSGGEQWKPLYFTMGSEKFTSKPIDGNILDNTLAVDIPGDDEDHVEELMNLHLGTAASVLKITFANGDVRLMGDDSIPAVCTRAFRLGRNSGYQVEWNWIHEVPLWVVE